MNNSKKLVLVILATAALSGCATTRTDLAATEAAAVVPASAQVSRPAPSYGNMGGYRYRRFVTATAGSSS
jgi:uncharacterized protein YceK